MLPFLVRSTYGSFKGLAVTSPAVASDVAVVSIHCFVPDYAVPQGGTTVDWLKEANMSPVVEAETCTCSTSLCVVDS